MQITNGRVQQRTPLFFWQEHGCFNGLTFLSISKITFKRKTSPGSGSADDVDCSKLFGATAVIQQTWLTEPKRRECELYLRSKLSIKPNQSPTQVACVLKSATANFRVGSVDIQCLRGGS